MEATRSPSAARSLGLASSPGLRLLACFLLLPKQLIGCWSLAPTLILGSHTRLGASLVPGGRGTSSEPLGVIVGRGSRDLPCQTTSCPHLGPSCPPPPHPPQRHTLQAAEEGSVVWEPRSGNAGSIGVKPDGPGPGDGRQGSVWDIPASYKVELHPSGLGSVVRVSTCKLKGPRLDSGQGRMPGLQA